MSVTQFDIRSVLHGQMSLAAVNQICVVNEAKNEGFDRELLIDPLPQGGILYTVIF